MSDNFENKNEDYDIYEKENDSFSEKKSIQKEAIPHFFPTFRVKRSHYPLPIIITVFFAAILSYLAVLEGSYIDTGGYVSEQDYGAIAGLINGIIFTGIAVGSAFLIIYFVKKKGISVLKYVFGISMGLICFMLTWMNIAIIINLIPININYILIGYIIYYILIGLAGLLSIILIHKYFTTQSIFIKNFTILYVSLLTGSMLGVSMPLWTTMAILIGISLWDLFAVLYKKGPIKQMIDIVSESKNQNVEEQIKTGEAEYDTSKLEIGIGDFAFYSMLTSSALVLTENPLIVLLTALAIILGTGITIQGLKRNKILPGLPISIFLGMATMLISWAIISVL